MLNVIDDGRLGCDPANLGLIVIRVPELSIHIQETHRSWSCLVKLSDDVDLWSHLLCFTLCDVIDNVIDRSSRAMALELSVLIVVSLSTMKIPRSR